MGVVLIKVGVVFKFMWTSAFLRNSIVPMPIDLVHYTSTVLFCWCVANFHNTQMVDLLLMLTIGLVEMVNLTLLALQQMQYVRQINVCKEFHSYDDT